MIQRIQSIYFLFSLAIAAALFFLPLASVETETIEGVQVPADFIQLYARGYHSDLGRMYNMTETTMLWVALAIHVIGLVVALFWFKNRKNQVRVAAISAVFLIAFFGLIFYYAKQMIAWAEATAVDYTLGTVLPGISLILIYMAMRAIQKDDELIKSVDRLR